MCLLDLSTFFWEIESKFGCFVNCQDWSTRKESSMWSLNVLCMIMTLDNDLYSTSDFIALFTVLEQWLQFQRARPCYFYFFASSLHQEDESKLPDFPNNIICCKHWFKYTKILIFEIYMQYICIKFSSPLLRWCSHIT